MGKEKEQMKKLAIRMVKLMAEKLGLIVLDPKECMIGSSTGWEISLDVRFGTCVTVKIILGEHDNICPSIESRRLLIARAP